MQNLQVRKTPRTEDTYKDPKRIGTSSVVDTNTVLWVCEEDEKVEVKSERRRRRARLISSLAAKYKYLSTNVR